MGLHSPDSPIRALQNVMCNQLVYMLELLVAAELKPEHGEPVTSICQLLLFFYLRT